MELGERWGLRIETYLQEATHEVLKAVQARALRRVEEVVPQRLPYWLALDHERLDGQQIEGTSLMLLEIKGFSRLARQGNSKPKAVFRMMNEIWNQVQPLLASSDAEINHFAGGAALIFRGVYGEDDLPCKLRDTLDCGVEISRLFELRGKVRKGLEAVISEEYEDAPRQTLKKMKEYVEGLKNGGTDFNVRVISIEPPVEEALFGPIGATVRWQHSTLSKYVNALKMTHELLDTAQSEDPSLRQEGESFFLHRSDEPPLVPGFTIEPLQSILKTDLKTSLPQAMGLEIFRVFKEPDRELLA